MNERVRNILAGLEIMRDDLVALSAESWHSTDPRDRAARERVNSFLKVFDPKVTEFERLASDLSTLIQEYTGVRLEDEDGAVATAPAVEERPAQHTSSSVGNGAATELDGAKPHILSENFTSTTPYGFVLNGRAFANLWTWRQLYRAFCQQLAERDPARFASLPDSPRLRRRYGGGFFSRDPSTLVDPLRVTDEMYTESNLSANHMRNIMRRLLDVFGLEEAERQIYLRRGRHGGVETLA